VALVATSACAATPPGRPAREPIAEQHATGAPLAGRCAAEAALTRKIAETIEPPPSLAPPTTPPPPTTPATPEDRRVRTRIRNLEDRVRELKRRISRAAAPIDLEIRLKSALPPAYVIESVRVWLDDQPVLAAQDAEPSVVNAHVAPGDHHVVVSAVLRGNFRGGIYDSVGFCFVTRSGYAFVALPTPKPTPRGDQPLSLEAVLEEGDPNAMFSARPRLRFAGLPPARRVDLASDQPDFEME
jgi:hypothetical protein